MKTITGFALVLSLLLICGCGDSPDSLKDDAKDAMSDFTEALKSIKDKDSAAAAKDDIKGIIERMKKIDEASKKMTEEQQKEFKKLTDEMSEEQQALQKEFMRISTNPMLAMELMELFKDMPEFK